MKKLTLIVVATATMFLAGGTAAASSSNPNDADYWEGRTTHPSQCYKHTASGGAHGGLSGNGKAVVLSPFDQSWWGDHWELLVVKGGSRDIGFGAGNAVYVHPTAGTSYAPPTNNGGQVPTVSHWIVCKGETPTPPATTTPPPTTVPPTTIPPTTTTPPTTVPPTTEPPATTEPPQTTVPPTTAPETTAPPTVPPSVSPTTIITTPRPTTPPPPPALPRTGSEDRWLLAFGLAFVASGYGAIVAARRR